MKKRKAKVVRAWAIVNKDEREKLAKLAEAATPGPWTAVRRDDLPDGIHYDVDGPEDPYRVCTCDEHDPRARSPRADAAFIAAAREAVPALLAALDEAEADLRQEAEEADHAVFVLRAECDRLRDALRALVEAVDALNDGWDEMTEDERSEAMATLLSKRHRAQEIIDG